MIPNKPNMYHFISSVAPEVFNEIILTMKHNIDKRNIQKSLICKWLSLKVDKHISVRCVNSHGYRIAKILKLERVTKTTAYVWRFDLPDGDNSNILVRFHISRERIYEYGFPNRWDGGMIIETPSQYILSRVYDKHVTEALQENTSLLKDIVKIVISLLSLTK